MNCVEGNKNMVFGFYEGIGESFPDNFVKFIYSQFLFSEIVYVLILLFICKKRPALFFYLNPLLTESKTKNAAQRDSPVNSFADLKINRGGMK